MRTLAQQAIPAQTATRTGSGQASRALANRLVNTWRSRKGSASHSRPAASACSASWASRPACHAVTSAHASRRPGQRRRLGSRAGAGRRRCGCHRTAAPGQPGPAGLAHQVHGVGLPGDTQLKPRQAGGGRCRAFRPSWASVVIVWPMAASRSARSACSWERTSSAVRSCTRCSSSSRDRAQLILHPLPLGDVPQNLGEAGQPAAAVAKRRDDSQPRTARPLSSCASARPRPGPAPTPAAAPAPAARCAGPRA